MAELVGQSATEIFCFGLNGDVFSSATSRLAFFDFEKSVSPSFGWLVVILYHIREY